VILQILKGTPIWVYCLFAALMILGFSQSKTKALPLWRLALLPVILFFLGLSDLWRSFNAHPAAFGLWLLGIVIAFALTAKLFRPAAAEYNPSTQRYTVLGSWQPMVIILAIFALKYGVGVSLAMQPALKQSLHFILPIAALYGLLSGTFLARRWFMVKR
jgi:hypothetical protein